MPFPAPTQKQARILWASVTGLSIAVLAGLIGLLIYAAGWVVSRLSAILLPLAIAGILAYLLDPVVSFLEKRRLGRGWAIVLVFLLALVIVAGTLAAIVPRMVVEAQALAKELPVYSERVRVKIHQFIEDPPFRLPLPEAWQTPRPIENGLEDEAAAEPPGVEPPVFDPDEPVPPGPPPAPLWDPEWTERIVAWSATALPRIGVWLLDQAGRAVHLAGLLIGLALVPVYTFYFLWEKKGISEGWTDHLPIQESKIKQELVFVLKSINHYLILFFRGQVLVGLCDGVLFTIGFFIIGLDFAVLIGMTAGLLSIIPFLGVVLGIVPAVLLAVVQVGGPNPLLVLLVFGLVQLAESLFISPKIMGDRVGLHPLTIIIAVLAGTTLMGGIIGGILAIPLTAALRVLMFRYIWKHRPAPRIEL